jgi:YfiH family protein
MAHDVSAAAGLDVRTVREMAVPDAAAPLFEHPDWAGRFPWLVQGTTGRGDEEEPFDLGWFGAVPAAAAHARWRRLRQVTACRTAVHARQVHAAAVLRHGALPAGMVVADDADGHLTREPGTLLTVSVADCVPVFLVDPDERAIALLHAGWRGIAADILEAGLRALLSSTGGDPGVVYMHLGPAICGRCYEVGPEVHEALGVPAPVTAAPVDLRRVLAARALDAGLDPERITVSEHCTRCGAGSFFSHRGGARQRQVAFLGIRESRTAA